MSRIANPGRASLLTLLLVVLAFVPDAQAKGKARSSHSHSRSSHGGAKHHAPQPAAPRPKPKPKPQPSHRTVMAPRQVRPHSVQRPVRTVRPPHHRYTTRHRRYGSSYGYRRSSRSVGAVVSRLRSTHARLARVPHHYRGHRSRAMHAIRTAIQQLGHRSYTSYRGNRVGLAANRDVAGAPPMSKATADGHLRGSLQSLRSVAMRLGAGTRSHYRARSSVQRAIRELGRGLASR